jgi:23S rRNA (uracil1939-C5)-methyltransferase
MGFIEVNILGLNIEVIRHAAKQSPAVIAYISCDPVTLFSDVRELQRLSHDSFTVESIIPFDMFPHTNHVETLAILKLKKDSNLS